MSASITDEIIDAIIQNEHRHVCRPGNPQPARSSSNVAYLKPDWGQCPPEAWGDPAGADLRRRDARPGHPRRQA